MVYHHVPSFAELVERDGALPRELPEGPVAVVDADLDPDFRLVRACDPALYAVHRPASTLGAGRWPGGDRCQLRWDGPDVNDGPPPDAYRTGQSRPGDSYPPIGSGGRAPSVKSHGTCKSLRTEHGRSRRGPVGPPLGP